MMGSACDLLFTFTSNRGSNSLGFPDIDDVSFYASRTFWPQWFRFPEWGFLVVGYSIVT